MPKSGFRFKPFKRRKDKDPEHPKPAGSTLTEEDLLEQLDGSKYSALFLGSFERERIVEALERFGIIRRLRDIGYPEIDIQFRPRGPFEHHLTVHDKSDPQHRLISEIVVKEARYQPKDQPVPGFRLHTLTLLTIEWLLMQHFRGEFSPRHKRLPGQNFPGLGLGNQVIDLLQWVARLMHKDGLMNIPEYFHNGLFYSKWFYYLDPATQGLMEAIHGQLSAQGYDISAISFAAYFDCLVDSRTGQPLPWVPHEQVLPLSGHLQKYFANPEYNRIVHKCRNRHAAGIDTNKFNQHMETADEIEW